MHYLVVFLFVSLAANAQPGSHSSKNRDGRPKEDLGGIAATISGAGFRNALPDRIPEAKDRDKFQEAQVDLAKRFLNTTGTIKPVAVRWRGDSDDRLSGRLMQLEVVFDEIRDPASGIAVRWTTTFVKKNTARGDAQWDLYQRFNTARIFRD